MTRQKYFCGQPTPEGPCDRLAVRRGRCHHHGGGPPRCLHSTPDGPCQKFRAYGGTVLACVEHGGGKRCVFPDCKTSAQKGEFCVTHTNCKTCQAEGCSNFIQSSSVMCREHSWMCHHPGCKVSRASRQLLHSPRWRQALQGRELQGIPSVRRLLHRPRRRSQVPQMLDSSRIRAPLLSEARRKPPGIREPGMCDA